MNEQISDIAGLLNKAYTIRINDLDQSIQLAQEALKLSREQEDTVLIAKSLNHLSLFHMIKGEHDVSRNMAEEAITYYKQLSDERGIADAKYSLAGIYYKTDNFHMGLVNLIDCLTVYRKYNDYHNQARVLKSLGTIYEYFGDEKNAIDAYENSIIAAQKAHDTGLESNAYNPLSGIYLKKGEIDKAQYVIEKAIQMKQEAGDTRGLAFSLYGRAKVFIKTGEYNEAENDLKQALDIHKTAGEKLGRAMAYRKLGILYMCRQDWQKAIETFEYCLQFSEQHNIAIILFKCHYHLYETHKGLGDIQLALQHLELYLTQKEAVINTQTLQVIENYELLKKMETMEKEARMEKEKAEILQKQQLAEKTSKMKQDFLSTMSHEIRTPLNAVLTISSLLQDKSNPEEQELLESLRFAGKNLLQLVNDILDFTKLDSGNSKLEIRAYEFKSFIENLKKTYESLAKAKGIKLFLNIDSDIAEYYELDDTKMSQILGNLISNAIKYTEAGRVDIEIEKNGEENDKDIIRFKIRDTGIGIPQSSFEDVFESFSQIQAVTTRKQGGTGLGLAIVKKLVELHGSEVHLESKMGEGSLFYFDLLLKPCNSPISTTTTNSATQENKTALLAEDNMLNAMVATKLLSKWGITTTHAKNGIEAVEKSKEQLYDFILMDIHMPEMNGFEAAKAIKTDDSNINRSIPIFALTADITAELQDEYCGYFNGFLRKPIEIEKLKEAISKVTA